MARGRAPHRAPAAARAGRRPTVALEAVSPRSRRYRHRRPRRGAPWRDMAARGVEAYRNARPSTRRTGRMQRARRVRRRVGSTTATRTGSRERPWCKLVGYRQPSAQGSHHGSLLLGQRHLRRLRSGLPLLRQHVELYRAPATTRHHRGPRRFTHAHRAALPAPCDRTA